MMSRLMFCPIIFILRTMSDDTGHTMMLSWFSYKDCTSTRLFKTISICLLFSIPETL